MGVYEYPNWINYYCGISGTIVCIGVVCLFISLVILILFDRDDIADKLYGISLLISLLGMILIVFMIPICAMTGVRIGE